MLNRLTFVAGLAFISTASFFTQDVEAQRFRFRNSYRSCPQQVRYVPPSCATIRYAVPVQPQMAVQAVGQPAVPATPELNASNSTAIAPGPVGNSIQPAVVNEVQPEVVPAQSTQTSNPVAPVAEPDPVLIPPAKLQPVPSGDTEIAPDTQVPPALEPPKTEPPKTEAPRPAEIVVPDAKIEVPKIQPTPAGAKSILEQGK